MKTKHPFGGCFVPIIVGLGMVSALHAESAVMSAKVDALPSLEPARRVLVTKALRRGKDVHVYRRVTPPAVLPALFSAAPPSASVDASDSVVADADSDAAFANLVSFSCSVVTHPFGVSEIQWSDAEGRQKRVFAHEDLSYLRLSLPVRLGETTYYYSTLNYGASGEDSLADYPVEMQRYIHQARAVAKGEFVVVTAATGRTYAPSDEERDALDVLLAYYQINREALRVEHEAAVARGKIEAEARRIRELTPQTYELRFWPVISQRHASQP